MGNLLEAVREKVEQWRLGPPQEAQEYQYTLRQAKRFARCGNTPAVTAFLCQARRIKPIPQETELPIEIRGHLKAAINAERYARRYAASPEDAQKSFSAAEEHGLIANQLKLQLKEVKKGKF